MSSSLQVYNVKEFINLWKQKPGKDDIISALHPHVELRVSDLQGLLDRLEDAEAERE